LLTPVSGTFLINNYKRAVDLLAGHEALETAMTELGIKDVSEFTDRLQEEMEYLEALGTEPEEETYQMEYFKRLVAYMERK
jgi:ribosomal protein S10